MSACLSFVATGKRKNAFAKWIIENGFTASKNRFRKGVTINWLAQAKALAGIIVTSIDGGVKRWTAQVQAQTPAAIDLLGKIRLTR